MSVLTTVFLIGMFSASAITTIEPNRIGITDIWEDNFKSVDYVRGVYDCTQFSNDFYDIIKDDFNASLMYGTIEGGYIHCWLDINGHGFEATTGEWIQTPYKPQSGKVFKKVRRCW